MANKSVPENLVFGLALKQLDELQRLARIVTSTTDVFTTDAGADISEESVRTLGYLAFKAGHDIREILTAITDQRLGEQA